MKKNKLWFRRKTYGWGWTPITWEGWLVTFVVLVIPLIIRLSAKAYGLEKSTQYFYTWASVPILLMSLILICFRYGEKPKWQWGLKRTKLWEKLFSRVEQTAYTDGTLKIFVRPGASMSPQQLSFYAETKEVVDDFYREVMQKNSIESLTGKGAMGDNHFYSVQFNGPGNAVLELMYSPFYCDKEFSFNNLESNFDPYK